jgi:hypothetical protein
MPDGVIGRIAGLLVTLGKSRLFAPNRGVLLSMEKSDSSPPEVIGGV